MGNWVNKGVIPHILSHVDGTTWGDSIKYLQHDIKETEKKIVLLIFIHVRPYGCEWL